MRMAAWAGVEEERVPCLVGFSSLLCGISATNERERPVIYSPTCSRSTAYDR